MPGAVVTSTVIVPTSATIMAPMTSSGVTLRNTHDMEMTTNIPSTIESGGASIAMASTYGLSSTVVLSSSSLNEDSSTMFVTEPSSTYSTGATSIDGINNTVVIINTFSSVIGPGNTFSIRVTGSHESNTLVTIDTFSSTGDNSVVVNQPSSSFSIGIVATHGINNSVVITNTLNTVGNKSTILVNKPTNAPNRESSNSAPNIAAAVGGAVGAVVFIAVTIIIILVIIVVSRKRRKKSYQIGRTSNTGT